MDEGRKLFVVAHGRGHAAGRTGLREAILEAHAAGAVLTDPQQRAVVAEYQHELVAAAQRSREAFRAQRTRIRPMPGITVGSAAQPAVRAHASAARRGAPPMPGIAVGTAR